MLKKKVYSLLKKCVVNITNCVSYALEELEAKLRNEWDTFRVNCLKEREELYQAQVLALHRELQGATVPSRVSRVAFVEVYL